jgi:hypothetical protein
MMQKKLNIASKKTIFGLIIIGCMAGGLAAYQLKRKSISSSVEKNHSEPGISGAIYDSTASYPGEDLSEERLLALSDLVFVGEVTGFSPSFWNRDGNASPSSVEEWESTPSNVYHRVRLKVITPLAGVKAGQVISVTNDGASPLRSTTRMGQGRTFYIKSTEQKGLKIGDKGIFLLSTKGKVLWLSKYGKPTWKKMILFVASWRDSYLPATKSDTYLWWRTPFKLKTIKDRLTLYAPARKKYLNELEGRYRTAEKFYKFR